MHSRPVSLKSIVVKHGNITRLQIFLNYVMLLLYSYVKRNIDSFHGATAPSVPGSPHYRAFTITVRHTTLSRMSDWPDNTQHSQETDIHAPGGIRTLNPSKRAAADPRVRPRGHWKGQ